MPRFMPSSAVRIGAGASLDADRSRRCGIETEDRAGDLGATGSHEPGKSDDLSAANVKVDLSEFFPVRQTVTSSAVGPKRRSGRGGKTFSIERSSSSGVSTPEFLLRSLEGAGGCGH
jgi:hypothetical protein